MNKKEKQQLKLLDKKIAEVADNINAKVDEFRKSLDEPLTVLWQERSKLYREINYGMSECEIVTPATIIKIVKAAMKKGEL